MDYAIRNYANISALSVGAFGYQLNLESSKMNSKDNHSHANTSDTVKLVIETCFSRYSNVTLNPSMGIYFIDSNIFEKCIKIDTGFEPGSDKWANFSFFEYMFANHPEQNNFESLLQITLKLPLRAIMLNTVISYNTPQCFDIDSDVNFNNRAHSGEIMINMATRIREIECQGLP